MMRGTDLGGDLACRSLRDLLTLLGMARSRGVLTIDGDGVHVEVALRDGWVVSGSSSHVPRFGTFMVDHGVIDKDDLETALGIQRRKKVAQPLGSILCAFGLVDGEQLERKLVAHVRSILASAANVREGTFGFRERSLGAEAPLPADLRIDTLLRDLAPGPADLAGVTP